MRSIKYCVYKESPYYVAQCLNVEVSSFGETADQAISNLKEAVELYFEDNQAIEYREVEEVFIGESVVNA
jgi:predicted RNase H-like HicB family nuclease